MNFTPELLTWEYASDHLMMHALLYLSVLSHESRTIDISVRSLATALSITERRARTIIERLIKSGVATQETTQKATHLTFCKYVNSTQQATQKATQKATRTKTRDNADTTRAIKEKKEYGEHGTVRLTDGEYAKLGERVGLENVGRLVEILDNYKAESGKKYKSDYASILNWVITRYYEEKERDERMTLATNNIYKNVNGNRNYQTTIDRSREQTELFLAAIETQISRRGN